MAARGLVNGRGPPRSGGRDSAKRVVSDTYTLKILLLLFGLQLADVFRGTDAVVLLEGCGEVGL